MVSKITIDPPSHFRPRSGSYTHKSSHQYKSDNRKVFVWLIFFSFASMVRAVLRFDYVGTRQQRRHETEHVVFRYDPVTQHDGDVELAEVDESIPHATITVVVQVVEVTQHEVSADVPLATAVPISNTTRTQEPLPPMYAKDEIALTIYNEAVQGKFDTLIDRIESCRSGFWDIRAFYVSLAAEHLVCNDESTIEWDEMVARNNDQPRIASVIRIIQGEHLVQCAWNVRGSGWASSVSEESRVLFRSLLEQAKGCFLQAADLDREDPTPFACLQTVAMGLSGRVAAQEWLSQARQRDQYNYKALSVHCLLLMRKWHGLYEEESLDFAKKISKSCPKNHPVRFILIAALCNQIEDAAWTFRQKYCFIRTPWVKDYTLCILRSIR